jgi:hypothetical protein
MINIPMISLWIAIVLMILLLVISTILAYKISKKLFRLLIPKRDPYANWTPGEKIDACYRALRDENKD